MDTSERAKPDRMAYSIRDAAFVLGNVSPNHVRNLVKEKALDQVRIGRRVLVTAASIKRLLENGGTSEQEAA